MQRVQVFSDWCQLVSHHTMEWVGREDGLLTRLMIGDEMKERKVRYVVGEKEKGVWVMKVGSWSEELEFSNIPAIGTLGKGRGPINSRRCLPCLNSA
jgi:hypothetical protein